MNTMDPSPIIRMANAFYDSCVLFTATDLGVFKTLDQLGTADAATLAQKLAMNIRGATLLLDACVALELLVKTGDRYSNAATSAAFLVQGKPGDLSGAIRYNRDVYAAWGDLKTLVKTGAPVEKPEIHLGENADRTRTFVLSMHYRALAIGRALIPALDLGGAKKILDAGGGPGTYSCLLAKAYPDLTSTVLDLPAVTAIAAELIAQQGMAQRVGVLAGSYHTTPFPAGLDAVLFLGVLHQESPDQIRQLFRKSFEALKPGGRLVVMDMMTDATHTRPVFSALFAVNMALTTQNGWVFADAELKGWAEECGFGGFSVKPLPAPMPHWLATAVKP